METRRTQIMFQQSQPLAGGPRPLALALQGGGAHGAFTWGVLDALLEDGRWSFASLSGASAGAMNAVVTAQGLMEGGRDGARAALERFWMAAADRLAVEPFGPLASGSDDGGGLPSGPSPLIQAGRQWQTWAASWWGPGAGNPLGLRRLEEIVTEQLDFEALRRRSPVALFVAATHARSGALRLFRERELTADALLASACLPSLSAPRVIDGEPYIDGAFAANPPLLPLLTEGGADELLLVLLTPLAGRPAAGEGPASAEQRAVELALHAAFLAEWRTLEGLRAQASMRGPAWPRWWPRWPVTWPGLFNTASMRLRTTRWHLIDSHPRLAALHLDSRLQAGRRYFLALRELGRASAGEWLTPSACAPAPRWWRPPSCASAARGRHPPCAGSP